MPPFPELPAGFRCRPAETADATAIGPMAGLAVDEVEAALERPGLDASADSLVVLEPAGGIAAWAWVRGRRSQVDVGTAYRGLGLGTALVEWAEQRAIEIGSPTLAQTVEDEDLAGTAILRARGYEVLATNWELELRATGVPALAALPADVSIRPFGAEDAPAAYTVIQDAFDEWQPRRWPYDEWARMTIGRSSFAPELSQVAYADGELVGVAMCLALPDSQEGHVEQLAVRRDHRGKGLARTVLAHASFGFFQQGRPNLTLWTHSGTGALAMYERLGMSVRRSTTVFSRDL
ncbi:GNAT family N-acetyltransferase [Kribbella sp. CA-293567]|uniref:GNAT family N-acetyltransferase n=1 Tax=Kribbella sp. CA-293567 TaxID=3002436 RepID=UPI0022DD1F5C|nr:GNAT family N-acetyltransferase [Kribbella sp. CA-293567]WBQ02201.1 GNAT family N-acetyltransferase [Kribbella sp. CA-293567]